MYGLVAKIFTKSRCKPEPKHQRRQNKTLINPLKSSKVTKILQNEMEQTKTKIIHRKNSIKDSDDFLDQLNSVVVVKNNQEAEMQRDNMHKEYRDALEAAPYASGRISRLTGEKFSFQIKNIQNIGYVKLDRSISFNSMDGTQVRTYQMALREIQVLSHIGCGMIADVYLGVWRGVLVALKTLRTNNGHECSLKETAKQLYQEIGILSNLKHPHIVSFVGSSIGTDHMMLVTEYMPDGELYEFLRSPQHRDYSLECAVSFARDIASAMDYVHSNKILQCDLKTSNVLLTTQNSLTSQSKQIVKLSDFGSAVAVDKADHTMGTVFNAAPELLSGNCINTFKTDVYAFSMIMLELITRTDPYFYIPLVCLPILISAGRRPYLSNIRYGNVPTEYINLMEQCWHPVPSRRPTFKIIYDSLLRLHNTIKSEPSHQIKSGTETLTKRDIERTDQMFKRFLKKQNEYNETELTTAHDLDQQQKKDVKTLDIDIFQTIVTNNSFVKMSSSFDTATSGTSTILDCSSISNTTSGASYSVAELTKAGIQQLCDDLKCRIGCSQQSTNNRIDKWHLMSSLATLREKSLKKFSLVMAFADTSCKASFTTPQTPPHVPRYYVTGMGG